MYNDYYHFHYVKKLKKSANEHKYVLIHGLSAYVSEIFHIVLGGALNFTHSLACQPQATTWNTYNDDYKKTNVDKNLARVNRCFV